MTNQTREYYMIDETREILVGLEPLHLRTVGSGMYACTGIYRTKNDSWSYLQVLPPGLYRNVNGIGVVSGFDRESVDDLLAETNLGQHGPALPPDPDCPICNGSGFRFSSYHCNCKIGRKKFDETISANGLDLDEAKEAFHINRAETHLGQFGPEEKEECFCQYGLMYDDISGEAYSCTEPNCAAGRRQEAAETSYHREVSQLLHTTSPRSEHAAVYASAGW